MLSKHIRCRENLNPVKELLITLKENETVSSGDTAVVSHTKSSMIISIGDGRILGKVGSGPRKILGFEISKGGGGLVWVRLEMD